MSKYDFLDGKSILITGGTGSLGHAIVPLLLKSTKAKKIVVYSRDEMKQWKMQKEMGDSDRLRFFIGDIRDKDRLYRALSKIDLVVHAAATKIVPTAEYNPFECIKTNVIGAMNLVDACIDKGVKRVVALSTDKASSPVNLYGASKLASDKIFVAGNAYSGESGTRFSVVRYGNVMGSRGSVIPLFLKQREQGCLTVTDESMTRFMITLDEGVDLIMHAFNDMEGGEIYVKKIPSMKVMDIARAIYPEGKIKLIGARPGEKIHEQMIGSEDSSTTFEYDSYYKILPMINEWYKSPERIKDGIAVPRGYVYASDTNKEWMKESELIEWIEKHKSRFQEI